MKKDKGQALTFGLCLAYKDFCDKIDIESFLSFFESEINSQNRALRKHRVRVGFCTLFD